MANWKFEFSNRISDLIGFYISEESVHSDETGYYTIHSLLPGHAFIGMRYHNHLFAVIPEEDYKKLESGNTSVEDYIDKSRFFFGYYWRSSGAPINNTYWKPFEDTTGIHSKERISRYLQILSCRTHFKLSGFMPTCKNCKSCKLNASSCPFSKLNISGKWENEEIEFDGRIEMLNAIKSKLKDLGFNLSSIIPHTSTRENIILSRGNNPNSINVLVNKYILNNLLYNPTPEMNWDSFVDTFNIVLSTDTNFVHLPNDIDNRRQFCLDTFGYRMKTEVQPEPIETEVPTEAKLKRSFFSIISDIFVKR